jgi:PAS domain S-box-containing protein
MTTPSRIRLSLVSSITITGMVALVAFSILRGMDAEVRRMTALSEIADKTRALQILTASFREGSARSDNGQIGEILRSLDGLLRNMSPRAPREEVLTEQLRKGYREIGLLIEQWFASRRAPGSLESERRDVLASQIWMKAQFISDDTRRLKDISQSRILTAQQRTGITLVVLIVLLALTNGVIYLLSVGSIVRAQRALLENQQRLRESQNSLSKELDRMSRLHEISSRLAMSSDIQSLLKEILAAAADFTGTDKGNIQLLNPKTSKLRIAVHQGLGKRLLEHFAEHAWGASSDEALDRCQRVIVEDVSKAPGVQGTVELEIALEDGVRAIQSMPIVARDGRFLGVLNNHFRAPHRPSETDLRYVDLLARMAADLIEGKQAEDALRESEQRLAGIISSAMDAVIAVDDAQGIILFNPAAERVFRCPASRAVGQSLDQFMPARFRETHRGHIDNFGKTGATSRRMGALGALSGIRADGEEFPIEAAISHMEAGGRKLFTVILRDITERKRAEEELHDAHRFSSARLNCKRPSPSWKAGLIASLTICGRLCAPWKVSPFFSAASAIRTSVSKAKTTSAASLPPPSGWTA